MLEFPVFQPFYEDSRKSMIYELSYIKDFCWCTKLVLDLNPHGNNGMQLGGVKIYIFVIYSISMPLLVPG